MLYEAPPYYLVDGVSVLRDHADPRQFYYQPLSPQFVTVEDGGVEVPHLSLLEFRSAAGGGGFASFDVHLGLTPERQAQVTAALADLADVDEPVLSPVPVIGGTVSMMLFGRQSGDTGPGTPGTPGFVRAVRHSAHPALFGDNRAAFSVELDQRGVTALKAAMAMELSPIGVVYALDYLALRPAYHVKLRIDWDRAQEVLDETYGHEGLFTDVQISDTVEELEDERIIVFDTDTFVPEDDESSVLQRRDAAVARARDMITDAFFESSLDPLREAPDGWDRARDVITSFSPQRSSPLGVFSYKKTHYTRVESKRLDVDLSERVTLQRTIYPQGHLAGLFRQLGQGLDLDRLVTRVDVDDPWFQRRKVTLISRADPVRDPVQSLTATLTYDGEVKTVRLDAAQPTGTVEWASAVADGRMVAPVDLRYTVDLVPAEAGERPDRLTSGTTQVLGEEHEIQPRGLFSEEVIPVLTLDGFPFARYPRVDVQLRYDDPAHGVRQDDVVRISDQQRSGEWKRFLVGPPAGPVQVKLTYRAADGRDRQTPFEPLTGPQVDVPDPFPQRLRLTVVEALSAEVERAFVDLVYDDQASGQLVEASLEVLPDQPVEPFVVDRVDPTFNQVRYRVTLLMKDTGLIEGPWSTTLSSRVFVRADIRGHRAVLLRSPADFAAAGLERIRVQARAGEEGDGLLVEDEFDFTGPGATGRFEFDFVDPSKDAFELRVFRLFRNGMTTQSDWRRFDVDAVPILANA